MERADRKKTIFFSDASVNSVPTAGTDTFIFGVSELTEEEIARCSVETIVRFEDVYQIDSTGNRKVFEMLKQALSENSAKEDLIAALDIFAENFMNNPYMYESGLCYLRDSDKIKAKNSAFYLVKIGRVVVPVGLLKQLISEENAKIITKSFFDIKNSEFNTFLRNNREICTQYSPATGKEISIAKKLKFRKFAGLILIILSGLFALQNLLLGVQWLKIPEVIKSGAGFVSSVGFLTEKSYGINHNSVLCLIILLFSVLFFIYFLRMLSPFFKECKSNRICKLKVEAVKRFKSVNLNLYNLLEDNETRTYFILNNYNELDNIDVECENKTIAEDMLYINKVSEYGSVNTPKTFLPKTGKLVFMLLLVIFSLYSVSDAKIINTEIAVDKAYCDVSKLIDSTKFKIVKKYTANEVIPIYTKPDSTDCVVYEMQAGENFEIVDYTYSNDYIFGIRSLTQYGFIDGWIYDADFAYYIPSIDKYKIVEATASSEGNLCVAKRAVDSISKTAWCENVEGTGVGEYIDIYLEQVMPIDVVMIQIGNNFSDDLFKYYSRPYIMSVEFFKEGELVTNAYVVLSDVRRLQYFNLNKTVNADKVRFVIDTVTEGKSQNTYISELELYCTEQTEETVE